MIVKCIKNHIQSFTHDVVFFDLLKNSHFPNTDPLSITIGKYYTVYTVLLTECHALYYICNDNFVDYPWAEYAPFFEITDPRISKYWDKEYQTMNYEQIKSLPENTTASFLEWSNDPTFYYKLIEREAVPNLFTEQEAKEAISTFERYKELMDLEFVFPGVTESAVSLEFDHWLMCPDCDESWQDVNSSSHEMVKCPSCKKLWLSPYLRK